MTRREVLLAELHTAAAMVRREIPAIYPVLLQAAHEIRVLEMRLNSRHPQRGRIKRDREIVKLREQGLTLQQIASRYGITNPRVHKILRRAEEEREAAAWAKQ